MAITQRTITLNSQHCERIVEYTKNNNIPFSRFLTDSAIQAIERSKNVEQ